MTSINFLTSDIDYDATGSTPQYDLTVRARDLDDTSLFVDSFIKVRILPLNDNNPVAPATATVNLAEDKLPGDYVTTFTATDADKPPHGIQSYSLISGRFSQILSSFVLGKIGIIFDFLLN